MSALCQERTQTDIALSDGYEYTKGRQLEGKSHALPGEAVSAFKPGDKVLIKVDPGKPEESLFVGRA